MMMKTDQDDMPKTPVSPADSQVAARVAALVTRLPLKLRRRVRTDVMLRAVSARLILVGDDGRLHWEGGSNTLLAYFCGRMFSGDHGAYSRRRQEQVWVQGPHPFPHAEMGRLFGVKALKQARYRRQNLPLPECWELIDSLFDSGGGVNLW